MGNPLVLPEGYREIFKIDMQKDKKKAILINGLALLIALFLIVSVAFWIPISTMFDFSAGYLMYFLRFIFLFVGLILYMVLHEVVHGIFMKHYSKAKVRYGFTGLYAFAGSDAYYNKKAYITIALAPVVAWGVVLLILNFIVPVTWFWIVYMIQVCNLSGAAGDFYVTCKFSKMPKDILVRDSGVAMTVYSCSK